MIKTPENGKTLIFCLFWRQIFGEFFGKAGSVIDGRTDGRI
jgi:hypothetical protein